MAKKQTKTVAKGSDDRKLFAFLVAFLSIVGFVIALVAKKDDRYVMFYAKQSLVVFIVWVIAGVLYSIPFIGWFVLGPLVSLFACILWIFSWVYALSGEEKETPIVGQYAKSFNF